MVLSFCLYRKNRPVSVKNRNGTAFCFITKTQSPSIAFTGHSEAQEPQEMQTSSAISYLSAPSEIASTGHASLQEPQLMQASVILYAIKIHLRARISRTDLLTLPVFYYIRFHFKLQEFFSSNLVQLSYPAAPSDFPSYSLIQKQKTTQSSTKILPYSWICSSACPKIDET